MPGELRPDATCPCCGTEMIALVDTANWRTVTREYYHAKPAFGRRKRKCLKVFHNHELARRERRGLETIPPRRRHA